MAAAETQEVCFVVAQVGGGMSPWRQELHRVAEELRAAGAAPASVDSALGWVQLHYAVAPGDSSRDRHVRVAESLSGTRWLELKRPYASVEQARASGERLSSYEPAPDLARLRCPLLAVLGAEDRSTPTEQTARAFQAAPRPGGRPAVRGPRASRRGPRTARVPTFGDPARPARLPRDGRSLGEGCGRGGALKSCRKPPARHASAREPASGIGVSPDWRAVP